MKILVAQNTTLKRNGGASRIMGFIHDYVVNAGHSVDYFCSEHIHAGIQGRWARHLFPALVVRRAMQASQDGRAYDLVNVHEPSSYPMTIFKHMAGNPTVVVTSHGLEQRAWELALEERRIGRSGPSLKSRLVVPASTLWQSRGGLRRADAVFCLNSEDQDYLRHTLGVTASRVLRIFPGASSGYSDTASRRSYSRAERLLFSGTWRKNKGIEDLVPAFITLSERNPTLKLQIMGAGFSPQTVLADFPEALRPRVECVAASGDEESARTYANADLFIQPSLFEGTPLTLMEAMASGLPVVTTATCGMKDVVRDGQNGLLVPIRCPTALVDAVQTLISRPELRRSLGRSANLEVTQRYTWPAVASTVLSRYEELYESRCHRDFSRS